MERQPEMVVCGKCRRNLQRKYFAIHETRCGGPSRGIQMTPLRKPIFVQPPSPPPIETIPCVNCGYHMTLDELDSHPDQCEGHMIECEYCHISYPGMLLEEHHNVCENRRSTIRTRQRLRSMEEGEAEFMAPRPHREQGYERRGGLENLLEMMREMRMRQRQEEGHDNHNTMDLLIRLFMRSENLNMGGGLNEQELKTLPKMTYQRKSEEGDLCTICYCNFQQKEQIVGLHCTHLYHQECITKWLKQNPECPVCKRSVRSKRQEQHD